MKVLIDHTIPANPYASALATSKNAQRTYEKQQIGMKKEFTVNPFGSQKVEKIIDLSKTNPFPREMVDQIYIGAFVSK